MSEPVRSKKMAVFEPSGLAAATGLLKPEMVRIVPMTDHVFRLHRRNLLAGLGATALAPAMASIGYAQARPSLALQASEGVIALRPGEPATPIWRLEGPAPEAAFGSSAAIRWKSPSETDFRFPRSQTGAASTEFPPPNR